MAIIGVFTNEGISKTIDAANDVGFFVKPLTFGVSRNAGVIDPSRTGANAGLWVTNAISSVVVINNNTIKIVCTISPGDSPVVENVKEIYLFGEDSLSNSFLLALGQPTETIIYDPAGTITLELQISLIDIDLTANYLFTNTIATELAEHRTDPNSHPEIIELLAKAGLFIPAGTLPFEHTGQFWQEDIEFDGTKATNTVSGVTFDSIFNGTEGNSISLVFDGLETVDTVVSNWNIANPDNMAVHDGVGTEVLTVQTVNLSTGTYLVSDDDVVYRDLDGVYKRSLADSSIKAKAVAFADISKRRVIFSGVKDYDTSGFAIGDVLYLSSTGAGQLSLSNNGISLGVVLATNIVLFTGFNGAADVQVSQTFDAVVTNVAGLGLFTTTQAAINAVPTNGRILIDKNEGLLETIDTIGKTLELVFNNRSRGWFKFPGEVAEFKIEFDVVPDNGTWRFEWNGQESGDLAFNANAATLQAEFNLFSGHTGVVVTGDYTVGFTFTFNDEVPQPLPTFLHTGFNEVQRFNFSNIPDDGTIQFTHQGNATLNLPWDDNAADLEAALEALASIINVSVTGSFASQFFEVEFVGSPYDEDGLQPRTEITATMFDLDLGGTLTTVNGTLVTPVIPITVQQGIHKANNLRVGPVDVVLTTTQLSGGVEPGPDTAIILDAPNTKIRGWGIIKDFVNGIDVNGQDGVVLEVDFDNTTNPILQGDLLAGINIMTDEVPSFAKDILSQLRLTAHATDGKRVKISGADVVIPSGITLSQEINSLLLQFDGAEIDYSTGEIFGSDGVTPLGVDFTPIIPSAQQFQHSSITIVPETFINGKLKGQVIVLFGDNEGASEILAPAAPFATGIKLGSVVVEGDLGLQEITRIVTTRDIFSSLDGQYIVLADSPTTTVAFWIDIDDSGTLEPAHGADRSVEITSINENDTPDLVAIALHAAINGDASYSATIADNRIIVTDALIGPRVDGDQGTTDFFFTVLQQGRDTDLTGLADIANSDVTQLTTGGGGGGTGDASTVLGRMEDLLADSFYDYLTPYIASSDQAVGISSTDGSFSFVTKTFDLDPAEFLISEDLIDAEFTTNLEDIVTAQVVLVYDRLGIDSAPVVELSRNNNEFQIVTMERTSTTSDTYTGNHTFSAEAVKQLLHENPLVSADATLAITPITTQIRTQEFDTTQVDVFEEMTMVVNKSGTPTGFLKFNVYDDNAGEPGTILQQQFINIADLIAGDNTLVFSIGKIVADIGKFHIGFETDAEYKATYVFGIDEVGVRADSSAPIVADSMSYDGVIWSAIAGSALVFGVNGRNLDLRLKITATDASKIAGFGVYYGLDGDLVNRTSNRNVFAFHGTDDNLNEFQLTFDADPDFIEVVDVFNGQNFMVPAFELQANKVVFPVGFFDGRESVYLVVIQRGGNGFDNSDENQLLLTDNHLGSLDPAIDKSVPGRGIVLAQDVNGIKKEIALDEFGFIVIL